ncbi:MAG: hypothetical protein INR72_16660, partial [Williamsia herbipolensis]|nr:hypothetical protein [Williamsia herbipolensis]
VAPTTGLTLAKIADRTTGLALGSSVGYTFRATNTGNTTLTSLTVSDPTLGISGAPCVATLAPGVTADCTTTGSHTITEADIRRGSFTNTASATGTPPAGSGLTPPTGSGSSTVTTAPAAATLTLRKAATLTTVTGIGDVAYTFDVTNAGNITVSGVSITETAFSGTGGAPRASCPTGDLAPGATVQCTATYRVTQADIDAGGIDNTATATAVPPSGVAAPVSPASSFRVAATRTPALTVAKSVDPTTATDAGEVVTYSYIVTNTGNVTLSDPSITETSFSGTGTPPAASCPTGPIAPGAFVTCTADYELTQADVDAGTVDNTATATAVPPAGTTAPVSGPSSASVTIDPDPSVTVVKSAAPSDAATYRVGTVVVYSFVVTNTGNVTVTDPVIDDSDFSGAGTLGPVDCGPAPVTIAPTDQVTCEASYTLVQADIDAGTVRNSATVTATTPGGGTTPVSDPSEVSIPQAQNPALTVEKSADRVTYDAAGEAIGYEFVVTNTGNVTITGVVVDETVFTGAGTPPVVTCPAGASSLVPGEVIVCEASYDTVAADLDAASVDNSAVATGTAPGLRTVTSDPSSAVVRNSAVGAIALTKTGRAEDVNGNGITDPGDRVVWTITVRNTGATRLTAIAVDDPSAGAVTCPSSALAAGDSMDCTVPPRTLSAADATAGSVVNTAGVTARGVGGVTVTTDPAVAAIQVRATPVAPTLPSGLAATGIAGAGVGALTALGLLAAGIAVLSARRRRISD